MPVTRLGTVWRYVLDTIEGADFGDGAAAATLVIALNFALNPSCALYLPGPASSPGAGPS